MSEKSRLQNALDEKQSETNALEGKFQRTKELLEEVKLERSKDIMRKAHQACQTDEFEITT